MTGRLSQQNAMRDPSRTAATAAALTIGVALVAIMATVGTSVKATMTRALHTNLGADYVVSPTGGGFLSGATLDGFSSSLAAALRTRPELAAVAEVRAGYWHRGRALEYLSAIDAGAGPRVINLTMSAGSVSSLAAGEVLVDASVAARQHLRVGDRLTMGFDATGDRDLVVGGTFRANEFVEGYVVSIETYEASYPKGALDQRLLIVDRAGPASSLRAIRQLVDPYRNLEVQDSAALKAREQHELDTVIHLGYVLMVLSILVAFIGIVNTLGLSIIERRRELGLLRVVGMHRTQVRRMVRGESIQVCLIGAVIGIVAGTGLGVALVAAHSFGTTTAVRVPAATLEAVAGLAGVAGVVASVIPARRAARLDVLDAIALR